MARTSVSTQLYRYYEHRILPHIIDHVCGSSTFAPLRQEMIGQAVGNVLEIGIGSGLNFPYYNNKVTHITGLDPVLAISPLAEKRAKSLAIPVSLIGLAAECIDAPAASFDTVVSTFTLCTIPHVEYALQEIKRVLKPEGRFIFIEHGKAATPITALLQQQITPYWKPWAGGCHLNRDIHALLQQAGFCLHHKQGFLLNAPPLLNYLYWGVAYPTPHTD